MALKKIRNDIIAIGAVDVDGNFYRQGDIAFYKLRELDGSTRWVMQVILRYYFGSTRIYDNALPEEASYRELMQPTNDPSWCQCDNCTYARQLPF